MNTSQQTESIAQDPRFMRDMGRKRQVLWILMIFFLCYYFALLIGAAYYRPLFAEILFANINVGLVFALSQYFVAGGIALYYAQYMKKIDASVQDVIDSKSAKTK
jgi:uncharacterized membrane protein (DUF485 family)